MSYKAWNGPLDIVTIANGGTNSDAFSMPQNALGLTIFLPTLTNALKIQKLQPKDGDQDSDTFADLSTTLTGAAAITLSTVSGLATGTAVSMDASVLGAGVFRFVSAGAEGGARTIRIAWRIDTWSS